MEINTEDYLKKTLIDSQERVRDFMAYAATAEDQKVKEFFHEYAVSEGEHAHKMKDFLDSIQR